MLFLRRGSFNDLSLSLSRVQAKRGDTMLFRNSLAAVKRELRELEEEGVQVLSLSLSARWPCRRVSDGLAAVEFLFFFVARKGDSFAFSLYS